MRTKDGRTMRPRAPLTTDRRTGGAHRITRELSAREDLTLRLNELENEGRRSELLDDEDVDWTKLADDPAADDYWDYLIEKLNESGGRF